MAAFAEIRRLGSYINIFYETQAQRYSLTNTHSLELIMLAYL